MASSMTPVLPEPVGADTTCAGTQHEACCGLCWQVCVSVPGHCVQHTAACRQLGGSSKPVSMTPDEAEQRLWG